MAGEQEYDFGVRRLIPALVAAFALFGFSAPMAKAQNRGVPTSVTSTGSGSHFDRLPGVPASVTSNGPRGNLLHPHPPNCCINPLFPLNPNPPHGGQRHPHRPSGGAVYAVPYPVYFTQPYVDDSAVADSGEEQSSGPADYAPGPTIFDRRGSTESSFSAEAAYAERSRQSDREAEPAPEPADTSVETVPIPEQPRTVLVFKDGHQLEVQNYAIVGNMLYDMTPDRRNKIAVADLDLTATTKANDDRGIDFQLPVRPATN